MPLHIYIYMVVADNMRYKSSMCIILTTHYILEIEYMLSQFTVYFNILE